MGFRYSLFSEREYFFLLKIWNCKKLYRSCISKRLTTQQKPSIMKDYLFKLAQELSDAANQVAELEAKLALLEATHQTQSKALLYAMKALDMDLSEMLDAIALEAKQPTPVEDNTPTTEELNELTEADSEELTDSQKHWYYASSTNPMFNPYLDNENC